MQKSFGTKIPICFRKFPSRKKKVYSSVHPEAHFIRQAVSAIIREKKKPSAPAIIAPIVLVAAKVMPKRISDVRIVPNIPVKRTDILGHIQL